MARLRNLLFLWIVCALSISCTLNGLDGSKENVNLSKKDDWQFSYQYDNKINRNINKNTLLSKATLSSVTNSSTSQSLGFAVGGAKDTKNFLQNLENGFLPKYDSITYEGLFYDYYFDTGIGSSECDALFCPAFTSAVTTDLYSKKTNYYLSVGLSSGLTEDSFKRKKLNLAVVLDISGSMTSRFDKYYYDKTRSKAENRDEMISKMTIANESIVAMMKNLKEGDRFGVVLFDHNAYQAKQLRLVEHTDMEAIADHILKLIPRGGTNWRAGYEKGVDLFAPLQEEMSDQSIYENRIIFLTDAMPNTGELSKEGLFGMVRDAANKGIYTSFIGVGLDFNSTLVEHVTKTRGANYYSVHSAADFKKRLADEFDFMVTPLVFDLQLQIKSKDYTIEGVYGSPEAELGSGDIMKINTLFPSSAEEGEVKGGIVLVKLKNVSDENGNIDLLVSYKDRNGQEFKVSDEATFDDEKEYDNLGIRKAILLTEHVSLVKNWLIDANKSCNDKVSGQPINVTYPERGIINPGTRPEIEMLSTWERKSCTPEVSEGYKKIFTLFSGHFTEEMKYISDPVLEKELQVLEFLTGNTTSTDGLKVDDWKITR